MLDAQRSALEVGVHRGDLDELADDWAALVDPAHPGAAFRSAAWLAPWWKNNSLGRSAQLLVVRRGAHPVAMLPLYAEGRRLRLLGDGVVGSDYLGVLERGGAEERDAARRLLAFHLAARDFDELELDGLLEDDPFLAALDGAFAGRLAIEPRYPCPFVSLNNDFDDYLNALPDGVGAQFRRRRKWLEKRPGYRLEILRAPHEIAGGLEILFDLHRQRWAVEGGSDGIPREVEDFHREAGLRLAALGWAMVFVLHVEGAPRAALYAFRHGDRLAFYQSGHEPAWRPRSVGSVLLGEVIRWARAEGLAEFDFLHGDEPYKLRWSTGCRRTVRVRAVGVGLRPWLSARARRAASHLRGRIRRALPPPTLEWIRRQRRSWR